ncbi:MAG TPA: universal stress protein [Actinospica sp.]|nr:universal stress protein [Actinospica sp.]
MTEIRNDEVTRRVVVGVDRSENAAGAARWAAQEALSRGAPLTVVHAVHPPRISATTPDSARRTRENGGRLLERIAADLRTDFPKLRVDVELSDLPAARALHTLSLESAVVVTGTRGHGGFAGMLLGSVSRKLAAHTHSPLVVVPGYGFEFERVLNKVVLGVEAGQEQSAIRYAFAAAQRYGAVLHAVRAWPPDTASSTPMNTRLAEIARIRGDEREAVEGLLAPFRSSFPDVKVKISAVRGSPVPVLIEEAWDSRLLVVGAHHRHGALSVGAGHVIEMLLARSPTPVAVVPEAHHG